MFLQERLELLAKTFAPVVFGLPLNLTLGAPASLLACRGAGPELASKDAGAPSMATGSWLPSAIPKSWRLSMNAYLAFLSSLKGLGFFLRTNPSDKSLGYYLSSLRDLICFRLPTQR